MPSKKAVKAKIVPPAYIDIATVGEDRKTVKLQKVKVVKRFHDWAVHYDVRMDDLYTVSHVPSGLALIGNLSLVMALEILESLPPHPKGHPDRLPTTVAEARAFTLSNDISPNAKAIKDAVKQVKQKYETVFQHD